MDTPESTKLEMFLSVAVEDYEARAKIGLTSDEVGALHDRAVRGEVSWSFYNEINNAWKADSIYQKGGKQRGWTIAYIREQLSYTHTRQYFHQGEEVHETIMGRCWPECVQIQRVRSCADPLAVKHEVEFVLGQDADIEEFWNDAKPQLEMACIDLLQAYPDNSFIQDLAFLPSRTNFSATIIVSAGTQRITLEFPIAVRYRPLMTDLSNKYHLDDTLSAHKKRQSGPLQRASTEELQELSHALWTAVRTFDETKNIPVPDHVQKRLKWHMGQVFKERSAEVSQVSPARTKRKLKSQIDRSGGSLDEPLGEDGRDSGYATRQDIVEDVNGKAPDAQVLIQQVFASLTDDKDREIVRLCMQDYSQGEIATKLDITQAAVSQRLRKIGQRLNK